jgi:hypothetical protein
MAKHCRICETEFKAHWQRCHVCKVNRRRARLHANGIVASPTGRIKHKAANAALLKYHAQKEKLGYDPARRKKAPAV